MYLQCHPVFPLGPWAGYEGQLKVAKPTDEQKAILETQFSKKMKQKKPVEESIEESTMLHSESLSLSHTHTHTLSLALFPFFQSSVIRSY